MTRACGRTFVASRRCSDRRSPARRDLELLDLVEPVRILVRTRPGRRRVPCATSMASPPLGWSRRSTPTSTYANVVEQVHRGRELPPARAAEGGWLERQRR